MFAKFIDCFVYLFFLLYKQSILFHIKEEYHYGYAKLVMNSISNLFSLVFLLSKKKLNKGYFKFKSDQILKIEV